MIELVEIKERYNFEPKYTFAQLQHYLPQRFESPAIHDSKLYEAIRTLTVKAHPTEESDYEKAWRDFYLPLKRRGYFIVVPLAIILYDKRFFLSFLHSQVEVCKGKEKDDFYLSLMEQALQFHLIQKKDQAIVTKALPNDVRRGRVLGKYILEGLLPVEEKAEILKRYRDHIERGERSPSVSLNDYLNAAALCYKASFGSKTNGLTAEKMYRRWADGRDCGLLEIKNKKSEEDFSHWLGNKSHCGGHPFEIVFGWHGHGIHLYPPYRKKPYFTLSVTDYMCAGPFLEMVKALIRKKMPFKAPEIETVLDYLPGESYFTVNAHDKHCIFYAPGHRKLLKHIEWDGPKMLKWS